MQVSNVLNNIAFGKVYAVAGTKDELNEIRHRTRRAKGQRLIFDATSLYNDENSKSHCSRAVRDGKDIALIVTGKKDTEKFNKCVAGWSSVCALTQKVDKYIKLGDIDKTILDIKKSMRKR